MKGKRASRLGIDRSRLFADVGSGVKVCRVLTEQLPGGRIPLWKMRIEVGWRSIFNSGNIICIHPKGGGGGLRMKGTNKMGSNKKSIRFPFHRFLSHAFYLSGHRNRDRIAFYVVGNEKTIVERPSVHTDFLFLKIIDLDFRSSGMSELTPYRVPTEAHFFPGWSSDRIERFMKIICRVMRK